MKVILIAIIVVGCLVSLSLGSDDLLVANPVAVVDDAFGGFYILDGAYPRLVHIVSPDSISSEIVLNGMPVGIARLGLDIVIICENDPTLYYFSRRLEPSGIEELLFVPKNIAATSSRRLFLTDRTGALYIKTTAGNTDKIIGLSPIERIAAVWGEGKIIALSHNSIIELDDRGLIVGQIKLPISIDRVVSVAAMAMPADTVRIAIASDSLLYLWDGNQWQSKSFIHSDAILAATDDGFFVVSRYGIYPIAP